MRTEFVRSRQVLSVTFATLAAASGFVAGPSRAQGVCPIDVEVVALRDCQLPNGDGLVDLDGISQPGAATLNALIAAVEVDPLLDALSKAIQALESDIDIARAAEQLAPIVNFATPQAALALNSAIGGRIDSRLQDVGDLTGTSDLPGPFGLGMKQALAAPSYLGAGSNTKGFVTPQREAVWGEAFGAFLDQDRRDLVDGYDADLYGVLTGYDNLVAPNARIGIAIGYGNTSIDGKGVTSGSSTDIDSYLVEAYGAVKGPGWYVSGRTGFAWHSFDTVRFVDVPVVDRADGDYDGWQFNAAAEAGAPIRTNGLIVTPFASLTYSHLDQDAYTETGGVVALAIEDQKTESLVSGLGVKALAPLSKTAAIEGRAVWLHEFEDVSQTVTASFAAGGGTFTAAGPAVGRDTAGLGFRFLGQINEAAVFELNYDANLRQDFVAHIASARLVVGF
ncbi:MAG: autotransporter outer membrane beta-barrel domain-containing protein [Hyphomicrobium sp.]